MSLPGHSLDNIDDEDAWTVDANGNLVPVPDMEEDEEDDMEGDDEEPVFDVEFTPEELQEMDEEFEEDQDYAE